MARSELLKNNRLCKILHTFEKKMSRRSILDLWTFVLNAWIWIIFHVLLSILPSKDSYVNILSELFNLVIDSYEIIRFLYIVR